LKPVFVIAIVAVAMVGLIVPIEFAEAKGPDEPCNYLDKNHWLKYSYDSAKGTASCVKVDYWVPERCGNIAGLYLTDPACQAPKGPTPEELQEQREREQREREQREREQREREQREREQEQREREQEQREREQEQREREQREREQREREQEQREQEQYEPEQRLLQQQTSTASPFTGDSESVTAYYIGSILGEAIFIVLVPVSIAYVIARLRFGGKKND
jgi:hypothetical protein